VPENPIHGDRETRRETRHRGRKDAVAFHTAMLKALRSRNPAGVGPDELGELDEHGFQPLPAGENSAVHWRLDVGSTSNKLFVVMVAYREPRVRPKARPRLSGKNKAPKYQGLIISHWWRRRESNPRPQDLDPRFYMRSPSFCFDTPGLRRTGFPECESACFNAGSADRPSAIPRLSTPRRPCGHRVRGRTRAEGSLLKQRGRNCCRWQL